MQQSLVPIDLLEKSDKILFIAHLAIGDFTYLQSCFRAFSQAYPHIKIHVWVDELRRTDIAADWEHLKKYSLYDWVAECPFITKVYDQTYSPALYDDSILAAQEQRYPVVISLGTLHRQKYARLARKISQTGFVAGQKKRIRFWDIPKYPEYLAYRKLDASIPAYVQRSVKFEHISAIYAGWFGSLFGIVISDAERFPFVSIPAQWRDYAERQFAEWGFTGSDEVVFLNSFSKSPERCWPLERVIELARAIRGKPRWANACFVVNVVPEQMAAARQLFATCTLGRIELFSAEENFFQLPAILRLCSLIISVETAVMHLANAVHVPVIALMRRVNPEWAPIDTANSTVITVERRKGWVSEIGVERVLSALPGAG